MGRHKGDKRNLALKGDPSDVGRIMSTVRRVVGRPPVISDEEAIERINDYFANCEEQNIRPIFEEMCLALGVTKRTVQRWATGELLAGTNRAAIIESAIEAMAAFDARAVSEGKLNPVIYIFRSKNFYDMSDSQEVRVTPTQPLGQQMDMKQIEEAVKNELIE